MKKIVLLVLLFCTISNAASSQNEPPQRFMSLKDAETNVRAGPGTQYPILWVYQRRGWPVEVLVEYDNWLKLRDSEGEEGWVYRNLLSKRRTVAVSEGEPITLYRKADGSKPLFRVEAGVVLKLEECSPFLCKVTHDNASGWLVKNRLLMSGE